MNFKEFFLYQEMSSIVQGPIQLYHGTDTGFNNSVLDEFKRNGAKPIGGGHGQGGGFYVFSDIRAAKHHAKERQGDDLKTNTKVAGKPMVVIIELPQIDFDQWDLDLEMNTPAIAGYGFRRAETLNKLGTKNLLQQSSDYLSKDQNDSWKDYGVNFPAIRATKFGTVTGKAGRMQFAIGAPKKGEIYDNDRRDFNTNVGSGEKLAPYYYAHQEARPDRHKKLEAWYFQKSLNANKPVAIKYTGTQALPVKQILIFDGQNWVNA